MVTPVALWHVSVTVNVMTGTYCGAFPSLPVPPSPVYSSVDSTPSPTKLGAATILGRFLASPMTCVPNGNAIVDETRYSPGGKYTMAFFVVDPLQPLPHLVVLVPMAILMALVSS